MTRIVRSKSTQEIFLLDSLNRKVGGPYKDAEHAKKARNRMERNEAMKSLGMVKGKYGDWWE